MKLLHLLIAAIAIIASGCARMDLTYWIEPTLTTEQRLTAYTVIAGWNDRVGVNGRRGMVVDDPSDANRTIGVRQPDWMWSNVSKSATGAYVPSSGEVLVIAGTTPEGFRRILDHEVGHSLGMLDHLPKGQAGLMDESATEEFGPNDLRYCREKGICQ